MPQNKKQKSLESKKAPAKKRGPKEFIFDYQRIEFLASLGMSKQEIAYAIGTNPQTWWEHVAKGNTDLADAYNAGKGKHAIAVFGGLIKNSNEGNVAAQIFLAKAHFGRRENITLTHEGSEDSPLQMNVTSLTPEQRKARIDELEKKRRKED